MRGLVGADLLEHVLDGTGHREQLILGHRRVHDVQDEVREPGLLERRAECLDQLMRELANEPNRVGQQIIPPRRVQHAGGRVEGVEEAVADPHLGAGKRSQQRRLPGVRIARERDLRQMRTLALGAHHRATGAHAHEPPLERRDPIASQPAVGLDLRLPRPPGSDAAAESFQMRPEAAHPREVVLELGQLDLQLALGTVRVRGKDVEDDRGAVDHRHAERVLEIAFLARRKLVVTGHQVCVDSPDLRLHLLELSRTHVGVGVRPVTPLDGAADRRHARGA